MAAATANQTLWGFLFWIKNNRHLSIEAMTEDELDALILAYTTENASDATLTTTDPLSYGATQTYPKKGEAAGSGVSATTPTRAICDQSKYPKTSFSGG